MVLHTADYISGGREIAVDYEPGTVRDVELEDGSHVLLRKLDVDYDPTDAMQALKTIYEAPGARRVRHGFALRRHETTRSLRARAPRSAAPLAQLEPVHAADRPRGVAAAHAALKGGFR